MRHWLVTEFDGAGFGFMLLHTHSYCNTDNSDIILQDTDIMVSQQQYYTQAPRQFYHQTPQQHGAGDNTNFHLTGGLETLQNALQYDATSHTNNGNFGGVLAGKHHVIIPSLKSWNLIPSSWTYHRMECQIGGSCLRKQ
jgi:hypothetical protein